ncbi:MAG: hypothetical protein K2O24_00150 [Muribaculaceae bacterium]|nr:hypothetical protein [Muribaculaceae bacterium]
MKVKNAFVIAVTSLLFASCTTLRSTSDTAQVETRIVSFTVADLAVQPQKVSRTTTWSYDPFNRTSDDVRKSNTEAELLKEVECDVLLEPQYIIKKDGFLRGGSITVTGYPAKYTDFHKMTPEEAELVKKASCGDKKTKKRKKWLIF